jgi:hypothetical protein
MAKKIGLGRKPGQTVTRKAEGSVKKPRKTGKAALDAAKEALGTAE